MNEARQVPKPSVLAERGLLPPEAADCATALAAERRRPESCKNRDQELKRERFPCLINSAGSSTYPARKSVRRTRATPLPIEYSASAAYSHSAKRHWDFVPPASPCHFRRDADLLQVTQLLWRHPMRLLCGDTHNTGFAATHPRARIEPTSAFDPKQTDRLLPRPRV